MDVGVGNGKAKTFLVSFEFSEASGSGYLLLIFLGKWRLFKQLFHRHLYLAYGVTG